MLARLPLRIVVVLGLLGVLTGCGDAPGIEPPPHVEATPPQPVTRTIEAFTEIAHPEIDECSGLAMIDGAYYTHNDSGGKPVIFRSSSLDFADAEVLTVPDAVNVDWEELAVLDGDLLVCDLGDNGRQRDDVSVIRVRYVPADDQPARLDVIARYPVTYADEPHDVEGVVVIDGQLTLFTKDRGEGTIVLRFDELVADTPNTPTEVGRLDLGDREQVTAADLDPTTGTVVLLTYTQIARYPADALAGEPTKTTLIGARQAEALCVRGDDLVFTNEQRSVYVIEDYATSAPDELLPERVSVTSSRDEPTECAVIDGAEGERITIQSTQDALVIDATFDFGGGPRMPTDPEAGRLGSAVIVSLARTAHRHTGEEDVVLALGEDAEGAATLVRVHFDEASLRLEPETSATFERTVEGGRVSVSIRVPHTLYGGSTRMNVIANGAASGRAPRLAGADAWAALFRPYLWATWAFGGSGG